MRAMKDVRVALVVVMSAMTSNSMVGTEPFGDGFKGRSIICNIVDPFNLCSGSSSFFASLVSLLEL